MVHLLITDVNLWYFIFQHLENIWLPRPAYSSFCHTFFFWRPLNTQNAASFGENTLLVVLVWGSSRQKSSFSQSTGLEGSGLIQSCFWHLCFMHYFSLILIYPACAHYHSRHLEEFPSALVHVDTHSVSFLFRKLIHPDQKMISSTPSSFISLSLSLLHPPLVSLSDTSLFLNKNKHTAPFWQSALL